MGDNVIMIFSGSSSRGGMSGGYGSAGTLSLEDAVAIKREILTIDGVTPEVEGSSRVAAGNQNWFTRLNESLRGLLCDSWLEFLPRRSVRGARRQGVFQGRGDRKNRRHATLWR